MNKTVALALAAGLLGGMLTRYIAPPSAHAQNPAPAEIRAQSFVIVDQSDHAVGTFSVAAGPLGPFGRPIFPRIVLKDFNGRDIWSAGGSGLQPLTIK
jgi:hypothetical protein